MAFMRFLVVGLAAGWILGKIRRGEGYGVIGNLLIGALGAIIGWFLSGLLQIEVRNLPGQIAMAVAGAVLFFLVVGSFKWKRRKKSRSEGE